MSTTAISRTSSSIVGVTVFKSGTNAGGYGSALATSGGLGMFPAELAQDRFLLATEPQVFVPEATAAEAPSVKWYVVSTPLRFTITAVLVCLLLFT